MASPFYFCYVPAVHLWVQGPFFSPGAAPVPPKPTGSLRGQIWGLGWHPYRSGWRLPGRLRSGCGRRRRNGRALEPISTPTSWKNFHQVNSANPATWPPSGRGSRDTVTAGWDRHDHLPAQSSSPIAHPPAPALSTAYSVGTPQNRKNRRQSQRGKNATSLCTVFRLFNDLRSAPLPESQESQKSHGHPPESQKRQNRL